MTNENEAGVIKPTPTPPAMDYQAILKVATHRYPFLMVDRILEIRDDGNTVIGIKNVTFNEPWTQGHFPEFPVMPGVMQIETMAQVGGILIIGRPENADKVGLLTAIDDAKFRRTVHPGDQLRVEARITRARQNLVVMECQASVDGQMASQATIKFVLAPKR